MNSSMAVPLEVVMTFGKVKALTNDIELVCEALQKSDKVIVDLGDSIKIRPCFKIERNILIIRNISSIKEETAVIDWLKSLNLNNFSQVKPEIGDNWFVTFNSDEDAVNSLLVIQGKKFEDKVVAARVKSDTILKNL